MTQRRRAFLTPDTPPEDLLCRSFSIPNEAVWLGTFMGALMALTEENNWEKFGTLTPEEAAETYSAIIANALPGDLGDCVDCEDCRQPGGSRVLRLNISGNIEMLQDGAWIEPDGDYTVPAVPAREESTEAERLCAAAANAANVLELLYETVADAVALELSAGEIEVLFVASASITIGAWLGLAMAALVGTAYALFIAFLAIAQYMTEDLWTAEFTEQLKCILLSCASEVDDVVTFDFQCVLDGMAQNVEIIDIGVISSIRLFGQVAFILNVIGSDGLDAAGATTEITAPDCSDCACTVSIVEPCGYGTVTHLGGTRWSATGLFVDSNYALCLKDTDDKCWSYMNWEIISGSIDYQDFSSCDTSGHIGQPGGCLGVPDTGFQSDILTWFLASNTGEFTVEFDAFCNEDCS